ncbi:hypothetical protein BGZ51_006817 [Haplosporangium sp. Z 767]|nr:hypothetical protein BGZ51_006817 [Haplosporangium sp. Z 767]
MILRGQGLVTATKRSLFFKTGIPNPEQVPADTHKAQQVIVDLSALSSSASHADASADERIEEGSITESTGKSISDKKKKSIGYEDDIIHEHDHADNDAYDDIVWYDGPHRDDEDEHGHEHGDDDHDNHDYRDEFGDHEDGQEHLSKESWRVRDTIKIKPEVLSNFQNLGGTWARTSGSQSDSSSETEFGSGAQRIISQHDHSDHDGQGGAGAFHHSGADILKGTISPQEFCLRLKHECESTCREFASQVEHLPMTCEAGSMAELLLWGRCCQVGQEHRTQKQGIRRHADWRKNTFGGSRSGTKPSKG